MTWFRQLVAVYLAVTLAVAGATGLSPWLHQLIEHGGHGAPHVHRGASAAHAVRLKGTQARARHSFALPSFPAKWLRQLAHRLAHAAEETNPPTAPADSPDTPGHQHHSLAQTLANGLVEAPAWAGFSLSVAPGIQRDCPRVPVRDSGSELDRQAAGRAPPAARG
jgi:hypothetical protein